MKNKFINLLQKMKNGEHLSKNDWIEAFKHHGHTSAPFRLAVAKTQPENKDDRLNYYGDIRLHISRFDGWQFDWIDEQLRNGIKYGLKQLSSRGD